MFKLQTRSATFTLTRTPFSLLHALYSTLPLPPQPPPNKTDPLTTFLSQTLNITPTKLSNYTIPNKVSTNFCSTNALSVITYLRKTGFDDTHIRKTIKNEPKILLSNVETTLRPKINLLSDLGLSGNDLARIVSINPNILKTNLVETISDLKRIMGSDENVGKFFMRARCRTAAVRGNLGFKNLSTNVGLLENRYGIGCERIRRIIVRQPSAFMRSPEWFEDAVRKVKEKWGIDQGCGMFLYAVCLLGNHSEESIDRKCGLFKRFGWSDCDVVTIMRKNPCIFTFAEERIERVLEFCVSELGFEPEYLASRCHVLMICSLEKRVVPRYRVLKVLKEKGLLREDRSLFSAVCYPETKFLERFITPYEGDIPGLRESYATSLASAVENSRKREATKVKGESRSAG